MSGLKSITYLDLLGILNSLTKEQLSVTVTVSTGGDQFIPVNCVDITTEDDVLDANHPVLVINRVREELPVLGQLNYGSSGIGKSSGPIVPVKSKPITPSDFLRINGGYPDDFTDEDRTSENIYWKDAIKSQHPITRKAEGSFWMCGGKVVFWHGQESDEANRILLKLEKTP